MVDSSVRKIVPFCTYSLTRNGSIIVRWKSYSGCRKCFNHVLLPLGSYVVVPNPRFDVKEIHSRRDGVIYQVS